jgi:TonB family protein
MISTRKTLFLLVFCLSTGLSLGLAQQHYRIIVHPDNPQTELTTKEISRIFLKKLDRWKDGSKVDVVQLSGMSEATEAFAEEIHDRSPSAVQNYWRQQVFGGTATPPLELSSRDEVVSYVREHPNAIAFVPADSQRDGVAEVSLIYEPKLIRRIEPTYPEYAQKAGITGVVILNCVVDSNGRVTSMKVVKPLSHGLTEQAKRAVRQWRFEPAKRNGEAVATDLIVSLRFSK